MKKELKIKVNFKFKIESTPDLNDWINASDEQKNNYVKEQVKDYLFDNIDNIIDDLIDSGEIKF